MRCSNCEGSRTSFVWNSPFNGSSQCITHAVATGANPLRVHNVYRGPAGQNMFPWNWLHQPARACLADGSQGEHRVRLQDKVAVVTGAGTGIGQAIALAFATNGAAVVVDYVGNASTAEETINMITSLGRKSLAVNADISLPGDVNTLIQKTIAAFGKLDILVNNAGIEKKFAFVDYPLEV